MNREQKIEAIYEKVADKTLSLGCKVLVEYWRTFNPAQSNECIDYIYNILELGEK